MVDDVSNTEESPARPRRAARGRHWTSTKKVLVVNDHFEVRSVITEFLRRRGLIAIPVRDADSARIICERVPLDLILLHLVVLDLAETALIRQVKLQRPTPPIVVISAGTSPELERECRGLAVDEILPKPIVLRRLERSVARLLRTSDAPMSR